MKCPNCNVDLVMSDRNGIEIDHCPNCRGIWLDRGELDKIVERSAQYVPGKSSGSHSDRPYHDSRDSGEYGYKKKKKESFLGDLFDF